MRAALPVALSLLVRFGGCDSRERANAAVRPTQPYSVPASLTAPDTVAIQALAIEHALRGVPWPFTKVYVAIYPTWSAEGNSLLKRLHLPGTSFIASEASPLKRSYSVGRQYQSVLVRVHAPALDSTGATRVFTELILGELGSNGTDIIFRQERGGWHLVGTELGWISQLASMQSAAA